MRSVKDLEWFIEACDEFNGGLYTDDKGRTIPIGQAKQEAIKELEDARRLIVYVAPL